MARITEDSIRELAGFKGEEAPVTSCYLDVDGRKFLRHQDYEVELDRLLRQGRAKANGTASVQGDLKRIEDFVKGSFDRKKVRGLAKKRLLRRAVAPLLCSPWPTSRK